MASGDGVSRRRRAQRGGERLERPARQGRRRTAAGVRDAHRRRGYGDAAGPDLLRHERRLWSCAAPHRPQDAGYRLRRAAG